MKLAARFPITYYPPLLIGLMLVHLVLLVVAIAQFKLGWQQFLIIPSLAISVYFSLKHYQKITQATDDLCWNGSCWIIQSEASTSSSSNGVIYLNILPNSWLTSRLSLLHFQSETSQYTWLFSRSELGERAYSHLVYLARQSLKQEQKLDLNNLD